MTVESLKSSPILLTSTNAKMIVVVLTFNSHLGRANILINQKSSVFVPFVFDFSRIPQG